MIALLWLKDNWRIIAVGLVLLAAFGCGWKLRDYQAAEDERAVLEAQQKAMDAEIAKRLEAEDARKQESAALEEKLAALRAQKAKVQIVKVKEYAKPAYTACTVPDDGLRILQDAAAAVASARSAR